MHGRVVLQCDAGTFLDTTLKKANTCKNCPEGHFQAADGSTDEKCTRQTPCKAGTKLAEKTVGLAGPALRWCVGNLSAWSLLVLSLW